jgi:cytochrome c oxidase subunit 2
LIGIAIPATKVLILMDDRSDPELNIKVTGYQWRWQYEYVDQGIKFFSNLATPEAQIKNQEPKGEHYLLEVDQPLIVPVDTKIRFLVTANDVIHSWWVPAFGLKRDAIPGFIHEAWTKVEVPGIYRGQCAELCGTNHGYMPIVVEALSKEDYQKWIDKQKAGQASAGAAANKTWTKDELMKQGEKSYLTYCAACHQPSGLGMPPTFPALKGSPKATGSIDGHIDIVLKGVPGTAMQAFGNQLSDVDLAAIITYERNAWGNDKGDLVQPVDIIKAKGGKVPDAAPAQPEASTQAATGAQQPAAEPAQPTVGEHPPAGGPTPQVGSTPTPVEPTSGTQPASAEKPQAAPSVDLSKEVLMKKGEDVYLKVCAVCHKPDGSGMVPVFPALNTSAIIKGPVSEHIVRVLHGVPGTAMQAFGAQLNDEELAAVITYERNAWNNGAGGLVQPAEIQKARTELKKENK